MGREVTACFVGLGSIGTRHLRNLKALAMDRGLDVSCDALRHSKVPLSADVSSLIKTEYNSADELGLYDLIFICNPSQMHLSSLTSLHHKGKHFFVEKPVFVNPYKGHEFDDSNKFYVACPLRHTKVFAWMNEFVRMHKIISVRAICSSYLPEWRPNQDYRALYSARKESGGVKVDLIHEFDYLFSLFGLPRKSHLIEGKYSNLEIESNDYVAFIGEYEDKLIELHLDYFGRNPRRFVELYTEDDIVVCDFIKAEVLFLKSGSIIELKENRNDYYLREISYFLDLVNGGVKNINPIPFANNVLNVLYA